MVGIACGGHGDGGVVHDGRRMERAVTVTTEPQWVPTDEDITGAQVTAFARVAEQRTGKTFADYQALWRWSVEDVEGFWGALWDYFELGEHSGVLEGSDMPGVTWFPGTTLNYVDQV